MPAGISPAGGPTPETEGGAILQQVTTLKDALTQAKKTGPFGPRKVAFADCLTQRPPLEGAKRDPQGQFVKGTCGGPGRRQSFALLIRELTNDGEELVMHALEIMRGQRVVSISRADSEDAVELRPSISEQQAARAWLADRGFGKAAERIEIAPGTPEVHTATLTALEPDDARAYFAITRRLAGRTVEGVLVPPAGAAESAATAGGRRDGPEPARAGAESSPAGDPGTDAS